MCSFLHVSSIRLLNSVCLAVCRFLEFHCISGRSLVLSALLNRKPSCFHAGFHRHNLRKCLGAQKKDNPVSPFMNLRLCEWGMLYRHKHWREESGDRPEGAGVFLTSFLLSHFVKSPTSNQTCEYNEDVSRQSKLFF